MANQLFNYSSTYSSRYGSNAAAAAADPYQYDSAAMGASRFISSPAEPTRLASLDRTGASMFLSQKESLRLRASEAARNGVAAGSAYSWGVMDGYGGALPASESISAPGIKRNAEAFYHQNILGTHNAIGQTEALFSTNPLVKRPRFETASHLPIYPQRPGEKDCAHYMLTRTCKFGESCKFDHPTWVPEGGMPDWKEVPQAPAAESLPERPGEPDCSYFMKHKKCKFGNSCKFNHPKDESTESSNAIALPERPSEPVCSFYAKTGKCKFGSKCIYHHPKDIQISGGQDPGSGEKKDFVATDNAASAVQKESATFTPALLHNSKGLPIRPGEQDCTFYMKTGSCKFGATCCYNHPDRISLRPSAATALGHTTFNAAGLINPGVSLIPNVEIRLNQQALVGGVLYPQRPGESECDFYLKTGHCKFGDRCKFHHPMDRSGLSTTKQASHQNVKLTLAGLPRREGSIMCPFYMKTGTCKFGATCKYDHPPPGEVIAKSAGQDSGNAAADESGEMKNADETII